MAKGGYEAALIEEYLLLVFFPSVGCSQAQVMITSLPGENVHGSATLVNSLAITQKN